MDPGDRRAARPGNPVAAIVGDSTCLHYVTLPGYDAKRFYAYDSLLEEDLNGALAGNTSVRHEELSRRMAAARFRGLRLNLAMALD